MRFSPRLILLTTLLVAGRSPPARAQYLYLDANRDGVWSSADQLNPDTTTVFIWLDTNHDRDGSTRVCNDHTGAASSRTTLNVFSYDLILHATGGTVTYSTITSPGFNANGTEYQSETDVIIHRTRPLGSTLSGLHLLGYVTITVTGGSPAIGVANGTSVEPGAYGTGFGTDCDGSDYANTYVLGTDWFDAGGAGEPQFPPSITAPTSVTQPEGTAVSIVATATDPDQGDQLAISVSGYPGSLGLAIDEPSAGVATATLSGTLSYQDAGVYSIVWEASDGTSPPVSATTNLEVPERNVAPFVYAPASISGQENSLITVQVFADDDDAEGIDSLTVDLSELPLGNDAIFTTSAENDQGVLTWTPTFADAGTYRIIFAASNSLTTRDTTTITVLNIPRTPRAVRISLPAPRYEVLAWFLDSDCPETPAGHVCAGSWFIAGDSGQVYVPYERCPDGETCELWEEVRVHFPMANTSADIKDRILFPDQTWFPPESAPPAYLNVAGSEDYTRRLLRRIQNAHDFCERKYGIARGQMEIHLETGTPRHYADVLGREWIGLPADEGYFRGDSLHEGWTVTHEYTHALQYTVYSWDSPWGDHDWCRPENGDQLSWVEGMADGVAEHFIQSTTSDSVHFGRAQPFLPTIYCGLKGPEIELDVARYVLWMVQRSAREFMDCFRFANFAVPSGQVYYARRVQEFHALWNDAAPALNYWVVTHRPGSWSDQAVYDYVIQGTLSAVVEASPPASEGWIQKVYPIPANGKVSVVAKAPSGGSAVAELFSPQGQRVRAYKFDGLALGLHTLVIDVGGLGSGVYMLQYRDPGGNSVRAAAKIVVLK